MPISTKKSIEGKYRGYQECPKCGAIYNPNYKDRFCERCGTFLLTRTWSDMELAKLITAQGTYKNIQEYVKWKYGVTVKTCWIAHVKAVYGENRDKTRKVPRVNPCPERHWNKIVDALSYFGII